ncbi:hypothetical protein M513_13656 [Trichuris suis]|uniref:Uncharacterized protein n=1 Tax=Trichuris suis TaxID=68888 RepID=A0A085LKH0_9BILA|nr:hypothetical protein M513_13656 [Trichuris suis]
MKIRKLSRGGKRKESKYIKHAKPYISSKQVNIHRYEMTELLNGDGPLYIADYLILRIESDVKYSNNMDYAD